MKTFNLLSGETCVARTPSIVNTVLGSCLSVTMYHPTLSIICHAALPCKKNGSIEKRPVFYYVDTSLLWMIDQFKKNNIEMRNVQVKMFGGASMFKNVSHGLPSDLKIGQKNIDTALQILNKRNIYLSSVNIGDGGCSV